MGKNKGFIKYVLKSPIRNAFPMYLYGSGIVSIAVFFKGIVNSETIKTAMELAIEYYILKLTPFPIDLFLTWPGFLDFLINLVVAIVIGSFIAGIKWRKNV